MIRSFVAVVIALLAAVETAFADAAPAPSRPDRRPNVVFILADDMGYGDLGAHGNTDVETPTLDRLHAESTRLTRFYAQPVCTPTRACLMTGRSHLRTRAVNTLYRSMMDPDEVTMAELFRDAGYRTGIFGKWHLGDNYPTRPIDQGFEEAVRHNGGGMAHWFDRPGSSYFDPVLVHNGKDRRYRGYCNEIFFDEAIDFITVHGDQPFFCYVATNLPHDPLIVPLEMWLPIHERGVNEENAIIYAMMKSIDDGMARLLEQLEHLGLAENTIVIFSSDNGPAMTDSEHQPRYNANLRGEKKDVYEGGIRVPMLVRWTGKTAPGRDIDRIGSMIDVLPTLVEACGIEGPPADVKIDGKSLWPLLSTEAAPAQWPDRTLFFQWHNAPEPEPYRNCAVRTQRWKLVDGKELYDLEADPAEANDIAAAHPQVVSDLRAQYEAWYADVSSTRGFDPPRIRLGTPHENPTVLNRRDWYLDQVPERGQEPLGVWKVDVVNGGEYRVSITLRQRQHAPGEVHLQLGDVHLVQPFKTTPKAIGDVLVELPRASLPQGPGDLKAWYVAPGKSPAGVALVTLERM